MSIEFVVFNVNVSIILVAAVVVTSSSFPSFAAASGSLVLVLRRSNAGPLWFRRRAGGSKAESSAGVRTWEATVNTDADEVDDDTDEGPAYGHKRVKA